MSTSIFICLSTKCINLHHIDEAWLELKFTIIGVECWSNMNVLSAWSREFMQSLLSHGSQKLMLSFFLIWLILIDKELWITTSPTLTLHKMYKQKQTRVSLLKQRLWFIYKYLFLLPYYSFFLSNGAKNACRHFLHHYVLSCHP
jgi:hypothetical protein